MPDTKILFVVPDNVDGLASVLCDQGGRLEFEPEFETYDDASAYLSNRKGEILTAEFEDVEDSHEPLYEFTKELDGHEAAYLAVADAYEDRSRSDRYDGLIAYDLFDKVAGRVQVNYRWSEGDPELDERTLRNADIDETEIAKIVAKLMTNAPAPVPGS